MTEAPTHDWNGASGDNWVAHQTRLDLMLEAFGNAAIAAAAPKPGEHILDIGCGAGVTSLALGQCVGTTGHVLGVDISPQLVARARTIVPQDASVTFELSDAATAPLQPQGFDLWFSRFGVRFFDDPVAAFSHMRTGLKPGGRLAFACWRGARENGWVRLPIDAIRTLVQPVPADPLAPGPFAFSNPDRISSILAAAGFAAVETLPFDTTISYGYGATRTEAIEDALTLAFAVGPLSRALAGQPDPVRAQAATLVRDAFLAQPGEASVLIDGAAWIVTARNPVARAA